MPSFTDRESASGQIKLAQASNNQSPAIAEKILEYASDSAGALVVLIVLVSFLSRKRIAAFSDRLIDLLATMKTTQADITQVVKRNSETLERVSCNDQKVADTLALQQQTIETLLREAPLIKNKQEDQIQRLRYAIKLLEYNAQLIIEISRTLKISTEALPEKFEDPEEN